MHRSTYTIRTSLNDSWWDLVINPSSNGIKRDITLRTFACIILASIVYIFLITKPTLLHAGLLSQVLFSISYFWIILWFVTPSKTQILGTHYVVVMFNYLFSGVSKHIVTRSNSKAMPVYTLFGIKEIQNDGQILYANDEVGVCLDVAGNASVLMFNEDKEAILDHTSKFFSNLPINSTIILDTSTSPQKIDKQMKAKESQKNNMVLKNSNLSKLIDLQNTMLDFVSTHNNTLHQFLWIRSSDIEEIKKVKEQLSMHARSANGYVSEYRQLKQEELIEYLSNVYSDKEIRGVK